MKKLLVVLAVLVGIVLSGCVGEEDRLDLLYIGDTGNKRVMILDTDFNYVDDFEATEWPYAIAVDKDYVYTGIYTGLQRLYKFNRAAPYAQVAWAEGGAAFDMDDYGDYLYVAEHAQDDHVHIVNKSDLSLANTIDDVKPEGITVDENYIYVTNFLASTHKLRKYSKVTLAEVLSVEIEYYGGMAVDDTYVYVASWKSTETIVRIYNKSDLSFSHSISTGGTAASFNERHIAVDGDYAFVVDELEHVVRKIKVSTDTIVATFGVVGESGSDTSHLYVPYDIAFYSEPPVDKEAPWKKDTIVPGVVVEVEIPRRSGNWIKLEDIMRVHTSSGKNPFTAVEIGQAEITVSNISKNFNSFNEASDWYKSLEGYACRIFVSWES